MPSASTCALRRYKHCALPFAPPPSPCGHEVQPSFWRLKRRTVCRSYPSVGPRIGTSRFLNLLFAAELESNDRSPMATVPLASTRRSDHTTGPHDYMTRPYDSTIVSCHMRYRLQLVTKLLEPLTSCVRGAMHLTFSNVTCDARCLKQTTDKPTKFKQH